MNYSISCKIYKGKNKFRGAFGEGENAKQKEKENHQAAAGSAGASADLPRFARSASISASVRPMERK